MNNMNKQEILKVQEMAELVGEFMRYWGFRNIHGELWTHLYLSKEPLSGTDLVERLGVSKALVSPALKELADEGLIYLAPKVNAKLKKYLAQEDVGQVIRGVLARREQPLIEKVAVKYEEICDNIQKSKEPSAIDRERLERVGRMVGMAQLATSFLLTAEDIWN